MELAVPMNRFRPNVVIDGEGLAAYDEDFWTEITIGAMSAFVVKGCDRCVIPDVDQTTAVTGKAVRQALLTRRGVNAYDETNKGVFFAQNVNHVYSPGLTLRVGDTVSVVERPSLSDTELQVADPACRTRIGEVAVRRVAAQRVAATREEDSQLTGSLMDLRRMLFRPVTLKGELDRHKRVGRSDRDLPIVLSDGGVHCMANRDAADHSHGFAAGAA